MLPPIYRFGTGDITDALANSDYLEQAAKWIVIRRCRGHQASHCQQVEVYASSAEAVGTAIVISLISINSKLEEGR